MRLGQNHRGLVGHHHIPDFNTNEAWTASLPTSVDWCGISPASGGKGSAAITVTVAENKFYDERNASITITAGTARQTVVIAQKQLDALLVSSSKVEIEKEGGSFDIEVKSNVNASFRIPTQYSSWLKAGTSGRSRGLESKTYAFTVEANPDALSRQAEIEFYGGGLSETVHVYQAGGPDIMVTQPKVYVGASGGDVTVELRSNTEFTYEITEGTEWLHRNQSRAFSTHTLHFTADPYTGTEAPRTAVIQFFVGGSPMSKVTVEQLEKGAIVVGSGSLDVPALGGEYTIDYSANRKMSVKKPSWIKVGDATPKSRAMEMYSLPLAVDPNLSLNAREDTVTIYDAADPSVMEEVIVKQAALAFSYTTSLSEDDYRDARSHEFTIEVKSDAECTVNLNGPLKHLDGNLYKIEANHKDDECGRFGIFINAGTNTLASLYVANTFARVVGLSATEASVSARGGDVMAEVKSNTDITYSIPASASWMKLKSCNIAAEGLKTDSWIFEVSENKGTSPRSAVITFKAGSLWSGRFTIAQDGAVPQEGTTVSQTVTEEGSLASSLGDNPLDVGDLTVGGPLNGKDAALLRDMAVNGKLTQLDLSEVTFRKDLVNQYCLGGWKPGKITDDDMLGHWLFYKSNLREIRVPKNLKHIGYNTFSQSALENIELPEGLVSIEEDAFKECEKLTAANIPPTVAEIPKYCFYGNFRLSDVALAEGLTAIKPYAFASSTLSSDKGALSHIALPSTLREIGEGAFTSNKLAEITVPANVEKIGARAFLYCRQLRKAVFECELDSLPKRLFEGCESLTDIQFPRGLKVIGEYALDHIGTDRLTIPEGVTTLMDGALNGAAHYGIELPQSLESIGSRALGWLSMTKTFTIPPRVSFIGARAFDGNCSITELHMQCPVPPQRGGDIFVPNAFNYAGCTLYVPKGCADAYRADSYWLKFKTIIEE